MKLKSKTYFRIKLDDPFDRDDLILDVKNILAGMFVTAFMVAFLGILARVVFSPLGLSGLVAELLARVAVSTGNHNLGDLMTGLTISLIILTGVTYQILVVFIKDRHQQIDAMDTNIFELGERIELLGQDVNIIKQRLVIEPALQLLDGREGAIDRHTGQILHVGPIDADLAELYRDEYEEVQVISQFETCPICGHAYKLSPCPECGNELIPSQIDPACQTCRGTGLYGICKEGHKEDERQAYRRGPVVYWWFTTQRKVKSKLHIEW